MKVLVAGSNGQLGKCFQILVSKQGDHQFEFVFKSSSELDISNGREVIQDFKKNRYGYCINCAAYTQVDKAETEVERAMKVNIIGAKNLAIACEKFDATMIHISTDFVFDGRSGKPYQEEDECNPLSVYGGTKLDGEMSVQMTLKQHFIIRTSWLYSEYGNNFMKTMLRLSEERKELSVIDDQFGTPTYAKDLAAFVLKIVYSQETSYGVYHYSNQGETTWYSFAKAIFELSDTGIELYPIPTEAYPTPAERPKYSVLDKSKVEQTFGIQIPDWRDSLKQALKMHQTRVA
ncbi:MULTISPECIES: dTDP-4-dehydrorhamnose reductase [Flavobacteriaceae]|uniref:dTDP-4-dehydrorhamnose reductase n=1 Tax=Flavobacteriaceae TaxID=49546 RepID=UPI001492C464|nr:MULTISPECIES: dTDP-4-dehydrorhamnose reductase [Allomuricauda]MDC6365654.1 dTDP-4-dehydrorhamnose reductase [Muricauda sp. AC10]